MAKARHSAGLLAIRSREGVVEVFLVHPGGPFFQRKDAGAWTIPKGLVDAGEEPLAAAKRELLEETGYTPPSGPYVSLGDIVQKGGKRVSAWAVAADFDPRALVSNTFEIEWPPRSGKLRTFPEVDRGEWLARGAAEEKILAAQVPLIARACSQECLSALGISDG